MTTVSVPGTGVLRALQASDLPEVRRLLDRNVLANAFVRYRVDETRLDFRLMGAQMWGWFNDGRLVAACHSGANVVPVEVDQQSARMFAMKLLGEGARPSSVVGPRGQVELLWRHLAPVLGPARSPRWNQPFLAIDRDPLVPSDPRLRTVVIDEVDVVFDPCVAMFTEEVGVPPSSLSAYRARVTQLVANGWSFAVIEDGEVLFKAEVAAVGADVAQIQGVWVTPRWRGRGLAAPALAGVVRQARARIASTVTLYVNDHNVAARRAYERVGFVQTTTFSSILL